MEAPKSSNLSWARVLLGLLPSLLVILQSVNIWRGIPRILFIIIPFIFLGIMLFIVVILIKNKGVTDICLPVFGAMLWEVKLILGLYLNSPNAILLEFFLLVSTILCILALYKLKEKPSTLTWWLLIGFVVFIMLISLFGLDKPVNWLRYSISEITSWFIRVIPILVIGFLLAKFRRLTLWLIVSVVEPVWIESYLISTGLDFQTWVDPRFEVQLALLIFRLLPLLVFLVAMPIVAMKTNSRNLYFVPAFLSVVAIGIVVYLRVKILFVPNSSFIFPTPLMWLFFTILLWMPILLSLVVSQSLKSSFKKGSQN